MLPLDCDVQRSVLPKELSILTTMLRLDHNAQRQRNPEGSIDSYDNAVSEKELK